MGIYAVILTNSFTSLLAPSHPHHVTEVLREGYGTWASGHRIKETQVLNELMVAGVFKHC